MLGILAWMDKIACYWVKFDFPLFLPSNQKMSLGWQEEPACYWLTFCELLLLVGVGTYWWPGKVSLLAIG
jgi:hypothetical protein